MITFTYVHVPRANVAAWRSRIARHHTGDVIFHFEFLWPVSYKLCNTVESVIKTYLSKLHGYVQNIRSPPASSERGKLDTRDRGLFNIAAKLFRLGMRKRRQVTCGWWRTKQNPLHGKLSGPLKEAVNRCRNYRVAKSLRVFLSD